MIEAGLILARFVHYAAAMALFGVSLFPHYSYPSRAGPQPARLSLWMQTVLLAAAGTALVSAILWLAFATANMAGDLSAAIDADALWSVIGDTAFGHVWILRLALSSTLILLVGYSRFFRPGHSQTVVTTIGAAALLATLAGTGHTMKMDGMQSAAHIASDSAHLLAAGAWFGGLLALSIVLKAASPDAPAILSRFSGMGYMAVATLVGSGLINSWFLVGSPSNLVATACGQLLLAKLVLFAGMLGLAIVNRFWLVPALTKGASESVISAERLRRHVLAEQAIGFLVISIVSVLGTMEPALGL